MEVRQKLRGTTLQLDQYLGAEGLIAVDTELWEIRVFNGILLGGFRIPNLETIMASFQLPGRLETTGLTVPNDNVNDAVEAGFYFTTNGSANQPEAARGSVLVTPTNDGRVQRWTRYDNVTRYERSFDGAAYTVWNRMFDKAYADTVYLGIDDKALTAFDADTALMSADSNLLDGQDGAFYRNATNLNTGTIADARLPANMSGKTFTSGVILDYAGNNSLEIGRKDGVASTPFLDFHSGAVVTDYDVRLLFSGGTGVSGQGSLDITAGSLLKSGNIIWHAGNDGLGSGLDADLLGGWARSNADDINTVASRDSQGDIHCRLFHSTYVDHTATISAIMGRTNNTTDNYLRPITLASVGTQLSPWLLPKSGGTLTGFLTLHANPTSALHAATKQYVDTEINAIPAPNYATGNAALAFGGVGTYALARCASDGGVAAGGTVAGSSLNRAYLDRDGTGDYTLGTDGGVLSGTWRNMGSALNVNDGNVFLRIS